MEIHLQKAWININVGSHKDGLTLTVARRGKRLFRITTKMNIKGEGKNDFSTLIKQAFVTTNSRHLSIATPHYTKRSQCSLEVDETFIDMNGWGLRLFLSNQGFAYRWETRFDEAVTVLDETFILEPLADFSYLYAYHNHPHKSDAFQNSWESIHHLTSWDAIEDYKLIYLPLTLLSPTTALAFTEAELIDYPGLNLEKRKDKKVFSALMARAPKKVDASGRRYAFVEERHPYLVQTQGRRSYPWRVCMMADTPAALYENDLPYLLSRPPSGDFSWVQAGRVAWEWWNAWGLEGVPFTPGVNTATYKAYIDFAEAYHLPYVILDEGWAQALDVTCIVPEINLPELIAYANAHNVKLILWSSWPQLIDRQEVIFSRYAAMGIAGFKIDFFDRDDCAIAQMLMTTAEIAAKYHLVLAYHGIHKPTGLSHTYPNVLTYEGVFGLENTKWTSNVVNFVQNDVRLAFARLLAGPMDYTPGAMTNHHRADYRKDYNHPMSMGTRCHQAAMFVIYDTGLQMLCDSPTAYAKEPAYTHFLSDLPLLWDETIALPYSHPEGCLAVLRRKGNRFVFAVLNNDQARIVTLPIWRLPHGHYLATTLVDGDNVKTNASHTQFKERYLSPGETMDICVAAGGGCVVTLMTMH